VLCARCRLLILRRAPLLSLKVMHASYIAPAAMCILTLAVRAEDCFDGHWDNQGNWHSEASLPDITSASECLARQGVLFFGGSTTRELFEQVVNNLGISEKVVDQRCDLAQGFGCYDCARGCHSSHYNSTLLPTLQTFFLPDVHDVCSYELVRRVDSRQFLTQMLTC